VIDDPQDRREAATIDVHGIRPPAAYGLVPRPPDDGVTVLEAHGELDLAAAPLLREHVDRADGTAVVLDLSGVSFIDSAVLKELLRARAELAARDVRLVLAGVPRPVRRLLDLTRTSELFDDAPDAETAVRRLSA
jgi:anti-sigma B factor antagonist